MSTIEYLNAHPIYGCIFIFLARVTDVSLDVFRILLLNRGYAVQAAAIGFFEISIYVVALGTVLADGPMDIYKIVVYSLGFACGNLVGAHIEEKMALGYVALYVFSCPTGCKDLLDELRENNFGVTNVTGHGREGPRELLIITAKRRDLPNILRILHTTSPDTFYSVSDIRSLRGGIFPIR